MRDSICEIFLISERKLFKMLSISHYLNSFIFCFTFLFSFIIVYENGNIYLMKFNIKDMLCAFTAIYYLKKCGGICVLRFLSLFLSVSLSRSKMRENTQCGGGKTSKRIVFPCRKANNKLKDLEGYCC